MFASKSPKLSHQSLALIASAAICLAGCGGGDDGSYRVSGKVTFAGNPIPAGKIYFTPDGAKGNAGPSGYATIENGTFDTGASGGKPTIGGPSIVRIEGFDPSVSAAPPGDDSGEEVFKSLFPTYETTAELAEKSSTLEIDVPAEAANKQNRPEGGSGGP